jgi:hypothetical protein
VRSKSADVTGRRPVVGAVSSGGATNGGTGFVPTRVGVGQYVLRFSSLRAIISAVANPTSGPGSISPTWSANVVTFNTYNAAGALTDTSFTFRVEALPR